MSDNYSERMEEAVQKLEVVKLSYTSTKESLFLEADISGIGKVLLPTARLSDLMFHRIGFSVLVFHNNVQDSTIEKLFEDPSEKYPKQTSIRLNDALLVSNELFSYAYNFFPNSRIVEEWKKIHEPKGKPKTVVKD